MFYAVPLDCQRRGANYRPEFYTYAFDPMEASRYLISNRCLPDRKFRFGIAAHAIPRFFHNTCENYVLIRTRNQYG